MMDFVVEHWPFFTMALTFWVIGHFMETSVFTKGRVQEHSPEAHGRPPRVKGEPKPKWKDSRSFGQRFHHWFFYWMRESMELHPLLGGVLTGLVWKNPEGADPAWGAAMSGGYFLFAGAISLFMWLLLTKAMEKLGLKGQIRFPGESVKPPAPPADEGK